MTPTETPKLRDHGGNLDAAIARFGGARKEWIDLSTGINPVPYQVSDIPADAWTRLPMSSDLNALTEQARITWSVPTGAQVLAAPGTSALIARMPQLCEAGTVRIASRTYNEHAAAFSAVGWRVIQGGEADAAVVVHPNNPDGTYSVRELNGSKLTIIDESFCDLEPNQSLVSHTVKPGVVVLKSFGKFWGLAGLRLGFAIGHPDTLEPLRTALGPWAVSGPALHLGTRALADQAWAEETRLRLKLDARRLDHLMTKAGARTVGGTNLFRLYEVENATHWQERLGRHHIWSRIFPYDATWLRLGIPAPCDWPRLEAAL